MFPPMAKKVDLAHLEAHHHELDDILAKVLAVSAELKNLKSTTTALPAEFDREKTSQLLLDLQKLVNDHEAAEESVFSTENLKKHFSVDEVKKQFPM